MNDSGPVTVPYGRCLGHLLRDLRDHRGLVQKQVCVRFSPMLDMSIYSGHELGKMQPPLTRLRQLATVFDVDRDDLITQAYLDSLTPLGAERPSLVDVDRGWLVWAATFAHFRQPLSELPGGGRCCDLGLRCLCPQDGTCLCECLGCHVEPTPFTQSRTDFVSGGRPKTGRHTSRPGGRPPNPALIAAIDAAGGIAELGQRLRRKYEGGLSLASVGRSVGINRHCAKTLITDAGGVIGHRRTLPVLTRS